MLHESNGGPIIYIRCGFRAWRFGVIRLSIIHITCLNAMVLLMVDGLVNMASQPICDMDTSVAIYPEAAQPK